MRFDVDELLCDAAAAAAAYTGKRITSRDLEKAGIWLVSRVYDTSSAVRGDSSGPIYVDEHVMDQGLQKPTAVGLGIPLTRTFDHDVF